MISVFLYGWSIIYIISRTFISGLFIELLSIYLNAVNLKIIIKNYYY
jgi:hypothetical protein